MDIATWVREHLVADPEIKVTTKENPWPNNQGVTDDQFTGAAGIPTYGVGAYFIDPDLGGIHGLNERIRVQSLYDGRDFLYELVKTLATTTSAIP